MKKKLGLILSYLLIAGVCAVTAILATEDSFSLGVANYDTSYLEESGMGLPTADADYINAGLAQGKSWEELTHELYPNCKIPSYSPYAYLNDTPAAGSSASNAPAPAAPGAATANNSKSAPAKSYSHDYDEITDTAKEAFIHFTQDGQPESCYLNIADTSSQNKITGKELNATRTGKEAGKITFGSGGTVHHEWIFENWESPDDFDLDLGLNMMPVQDFEFPDTYYFEFADTNTLSGNNVTVRVRMDDKGSLYHFCKEDGGKYTEAFTATVGDDGFLEFAPTELGVYYVSKTDIAKEQKNKEEPVEKTEEEVIEEPVVEKEKPEPVEEAEPTVIPEPTEEPAVEQQAQQPSFPAIPVVVGICVVVAIAAGVILAKKRKR